MNNMEFNKIFAALLVAGIIAMLTGFVSRQVVRPSELEKTAIAIEGVAEGGDVAFAAIVAAPEPVLQLIAAADVARGKTVAKACAACHNVEKGGPNGVGPNLWDVVGRAKGGHEGFAYSEGIKAMGGTWTYDDLNHFLWKPKAYVAGTKMNFVGVKKPEDRAAVIAYLRSLSDAPRPLPTDAEIAAEQAAAPAKP